MKNILYFMILLLCCAGCKKEQLVQTKFVQVTFENKTNLGISIKHEDIFTGTGYPIATAEGEERFELYSSSGEKVIDTVLNITGNQLFYIYQPFDIVPPVIVGELPTTPPVDPRNLLKNETAPADGYFKLKIKFKSDFIVPNKLVDFIIMSKTAESPDQEVPIETLHNVGPDYNATMFLVKRPVLADGTLSTAYLYSIADPVTGEVLKNSGGNTFVGGGGEDYPLTYNRYMLDFTDYATSRFTATAFPVNGLFYQFRHTRLWVL